MRQVLIVEDETEIAELIEFHLRREGLSARIVASGRAALEAIRMEAPDIVILDLMLPDLDGLEVCRRIRQNPEINAVPILMVSAKGEEADIVTGLELGADDYVTKPFSTKVLVARVRNILRRSDRSVPNGAESRLVLRGGELVIDPERHLVACRGAAVDLTVTEFGVLLHLASRPGFVRTRDQIIAAVHGRSAVLTSRTIDVHVTALRRKLGDLADCIETVRGVGYRFSERSAAEG
jgi:two-component system alkaline phosphatase synthesis response regulator PhoP